MAHKGKFTPKNIIKYKGNPLNITFRSNWELRLMFEFDTKDSIIWWSSEEVFIRYISPIDGKFHKYYPDFVFKIKDKDGKESIHMWEIKPYKQTIKPTHKKQTKKTLNEMLTYEINIAKWEAAINFCKEHGWIFSKITEKDLKF